METKTKKVTKTQQILDHLKKGNPITSFMAIHLYGATRLSAIIFTLKERGYDITTERLSRLDSNGNLCHFVVYKLHGVFPIDLKEKSNTNPETATIPEIQNQPTSNKPSVFKKLWNKLF
jgi:hypothetical protein